MAWTLDYYPAEFKLLRKSLRSKAIEIANILTESGLNKQQAISIALAQVRSWDRTEFNRSSINLRSRKEASKSSTNYFIVQHDDKWGLKGDKDSQPRISFDTIDEALERGRKLIKLTKGSLYMYKQNGGLQQIVY